MPLARFGTLKNDVISVRVELLTTSIRNVPECSDIAQVDNIRGIVSQVKHGRVDLIAIL